MKQTYTIDGKEYDRVTTILRATQSSDGLLNWMAKLERQKCLSIVVEAPDKQAALENLRSLDRYEGTQVKEEKADLGSQVHTLIEELYTQKKPAMEITNEAKRRFDSYLQWTTRRGFKAVASERTVYSPLLEVAGTLDLEGDINGQTFILDVKTGALRRNAAVQLAAYALLRSEMRALDDPAVHAEFERAYMDFKAPWPFLKDYPALSVLHIPEDGLMEYEVDPKEVEHLVLDFLWRLHSFKLDKEIKPFRRIYPVPQEEWLRAQ